MNPETTHPVQVLREHATELEAALSVCLADPGHRPVHRLRTETRRVEAQILLLGQLPEMPEHRREGERLLRALKRLRRAAGAIRDLDVQRKSLEAISAAAESRHPGDEPADSRSAVSRGRKRPPSKRAPEADAAALVAEQPAAPEEQELRKAARELSDHLSARRDTAVGKLQSLLHKRQSKAAQATEALLAVLDQATGFELPAEALLHHAQAVFTRDGLLDEGPEGVDGLDEEDLHTLRKAAKAARYLAENLPENPAAAASAAHFEALQQAGGEWHDALDLHRAARQFLGKKHVLTASIAAQREAALRRYRDRLRTESPSVAETTVKPVSKGQGLAKNARNGAGKRSSRKPATSSSGAAVARRRTRAAA